MQLPEKFIKYAKEQEEKLNAFVELHLETSLGNSSHRGTEAQRETRDSQITPETPCLSASVRDKIENLPFAVSDNIAVKGMSFTCGSKMLEHLRSPYTAAAVQRLEAAGGGVIGKTTVDEFGMGFCGGAAAAVAAGIVPYALGADAGGAVRQQAALSGVAGLKPTYGAVSRHGLAAYASSMESIGVLADTIARCRAVFACIRGRDPHDQTSCDAPEAAPPLYTAGGAPNGTAKKIGVLSAELVVKTLEEAAKKTGNRELKAAAEACAAEDETCRGLDLARKRLSALGHTLVDIEIPGLQYAVPAFYAIATAEAGSNLTRFDGIRFGARPAGVENPDDLVDKTRAGMGPEAKLQVLLGTLVLRSGFQEKYFLPAHKIRAGIKAAFEALLGDGDYKEQAKLDAILMPVFPGFGGKPFAQKAAGLYTICASLAGLPALSFPVATEGSHAGVQLLGRAWAEGTLLDIAEAYEPPFPHPEGFKPFWREK